MAFSVSLAGGFVEELVIAGGGIAGLGCLNALLDRQVSPLLLEGASIGSPKMCGEFLAPPVIEQLEKWDIGPVQLIKQAQFIANNQAVHIDFPRTGGAYTRHAAELELAARAKKLGGRIREQAPIKDIIPAGNNTPFKLQLASGEVILAREVIFATGKYSQQARASKYIGFKTHIPHVFQPETLLMYSLAGGYLGIVPVTAEISNITCLIKRSEIEKAGSCKAYFASFLQQNTLDWLEGPAPAFGLKPLPDWPHAYWIGDAFATVHPAAGYGFAHGVSSALMAADYYLKKDPANYHKALRHVMRPRRIIGACLHQVLQTPWVCRLVAPKFDSNPWMGHQLLKLLEY